MMACFVGDGCWLLGVNGLLHRWWVLAVRWWWFASWVMGVGY